jgi:hypothetical protein
MSSHSAIAWRFSPSMGSSRRPVLVWCCCSAVARPPPPPRQTDPISQTHALLLHPHRDPQPFSTSPRARACAQPCLSRLTLSSSSFTAQVRARRRAHAAPGAPPPPDCAALQSLAHRLPPRTAALYSCPPASLVVTCHRNTAAAAGSLARRPPADRSFCSSRLAASATPSAASSYTIHQVAFPASSIAPSR